MAVEVLYNSIDKLEHPDAGVIRLVYFGHQSEGQKKITRQVSEAVVTKLEQSGFYILNGLTEVEALLVRAGYTVLPPLAEAPGEAPGESSGEPSDSSDSAGDAA
jgi:hypothetical protein